MGQGAQAWRQHLLNLSPFITSVFFMHTQGSRLSRWHLFPRLIPDSSVYVSHNSPVLWFFFGAIKLPATSSFPCPRLPLSLRPGSPTALWETGRPPPAGGQGPRPEDSRRTGLWLQTSSPQALLTPLPCPSRYRLVPSGPHQGPGGPWATPTSPVSLVLSPIVWPLFLADLFPSQSPGRLLRTKLPRLSYPNHPCSSRPWIQCTLGTPRPLRSKDLAFCPHVLGPVSEEASKFSSDPPVHPRGHGLESGLITSCWEFPTSSTLGPRVASHRLCSGHSLAMKPPVAPQYFHLLEFPFSAGCSDPSSPSALGTAGSRCPALQSEIRRQLPPTGTVPPSTGGCTPPGLPSRLSAGPCARQQRLPKAFLVSFRDAALPFLLDPHNPLPGLLHLAGWTPGCLCLSHPHRPTRDA